MTPADAGASLVPDEPFDIAGPLPRGTVLLEASAGTGKTWTIAALVARYVAEGAASLDELLVVTFTRAASQELRQRVRDQLVAAERALADPASVPADRLAADALLRHLLDAPEPERAARHARLRAAVGGFDGATIATIHQFCQLVLRSLGVAGDTDREATLVEDLEDLLVEVVDDLYLARWADSASTPPFDRATALAIARAVVDDPRARVEPVPGPATADDQGPGARVVFAVAVLEEMERRKRRLAVLSYDDLLGQLADALQDPGSPARARMRQRWRVALIDEFQDTDPVQWDVFERAFHGAATLVLIGDPKQAIYAFRGGDVTTYLRAAERADRRQTLTVNHRADAGLLARLQALLRSAALGDDRIVVRDVGASRPVEQPRLRGGGVEGREVRLRVVRHQEIGRRPGGKVPVDTWREHVVRDLARDVRRLLDSGVRHGPEGEDRPLEPGDVAVLALRRIDLQAIREALAGVGVPAVVAAGGSVFHTPAARAWLALLEALEQPHRAARVRSAALTPFLGRTAVDLDGDAGRGPGRPSDLTDALAERMRALADVLATRGVAAVMECCVLDGLTARVLGTQGGERMLTDLRHVAEELHRVSVTERVGAVGLLAWLREQMADDKVEVASERTRRLDSDAAAVQLVTIHGSKGLEWPVVYLPTLWDRWTGGTPSFPLYHDDQGRRCRDVGGAGPHQADSVTRHRDEEAGESLRLLYVAATRAQCQVVAWWAPASQNTPGAPLHRMLFGRRPGGTEVPADFDLPDDERLATVLRGWSDAGALVPEVAVPVEADDRTPPAERHRLAARSFTREVDTRWRRTSYSSLSAAAGDASGPVGAGLSEPEDEAGLRDDEPPPDDPDDPSWGDPALGDASPETDPDPESDPGGDPEGLSAVPSPMADLPVGARFGSLVHAVLEHADPAAADLRAELRDHVRAQRVWWPVELDETALVDALAAVCASPLGPLAPGRTLGDVALADRLRELDFEVPLGGGDAAPAGSRTARLGDLAPLLRAHLAAGDPLRPYADALDADPGLAEQELRGYLTGSIDVVLRVGAPDGAGTTYLTVDYKTNWLGGAAGELSAHDYRPAALAEAMGHSAYPLQALLYQVVLHRYLRWRLPDYDPERHLGGVLYLYLRGMCGEATPLVDGHPCGVFSWRPPVALVRELSDLLDRGAPGAGTGGSP